MYLLLLPHNFRKKCDKTTVEFQQGTATPDQLREGMESKNSNT